MNAVKTQGEDGILCTAVRLAAGDTYFGRNLDLEFAYEEEVTVMPRQFPLAHRSMPPVLRHYAMIGTAFVVEGAPLYYDAVNEKGLAAAALNFPRYAHYAPPTGEGELAPFEVIPWVLAQCATVEEAAALLRTVRIAAIDHSAALPATPLHWLLADRDRAVAVEPLEDGLHLTDDPVNVLTNSPPLDYHLTRLADHTALTVDTPPAAFGDVPLPLYSRGMGAAGLPGDWSSCSRFIKAAFVTAHAVTDGREWQGVSQMFHILQSVAHPRGVVRMPDGRYEITVYSACCNMCTGDYYYRTYDGGTYAVSLRHTDTDGEALVRFPMIKNDTVSWQNGPSVVY